MTKDASLSLLAGLFLGYFALPSVLSFAFAADHNGAQLPVVIPQSTFDYVAAKGKFDSRGSLTHWVACGHTVDFLQAELAAEKQAREACESGAIVSECKTPKFPDGSGGALWKPVAEGGSAGDHATFLGSNSIQSVEVLDAAFKNVETLKLRYYNGPGGRSVWDSRGSSANYPKNIVVRARFADGKCEDRHVSDPTQRVD